MLMPFLRKGGFYNQKLIRILNIDQIFSIKLAGNSEYVSKCWLILLMSFNRFQFHTNIQNNRFQNNNVLSLCQLVIKSPVKE